MVTGNQCARLIIVCGLPGSGKKRLRAKAHEASALARCDFVLTNGSTIFPLVFKDEEKRAKIRGNAMEVSARFSYSRSERCYRMGYVGKV